MRGSVHSGEIIASTRNTITLKLDGEGVLLIPRADVQSVRVEVDDTGVFEGPLLDWDSKSERIQALGYIVNLQDRTIMARADEPGVPDQTSALAAVNSTDLVEMPSLLLIASSAQADIYSASVAIESLIKMRVLPEIGIDVRTTFIEAADETSLLLESGDADLGIIFVPSDRPGSSVPLTRGIRKVARLWERQGGALELVATKGLSNQTIYEIARAIFENLPMLTHISGSFAETSLDMASAPSPFPIHPGAFRYYWERGALTSVDVEPVTSIRHGFGSRAQM